MASPKSIAPKSTPTAAPEPAFHPLCELFPKIAKGTVEYIEFEQDIKANGIREAIWLWKDASGKVWLIDGKNRWMTAQKLHIACPERWYTGDEKSLLAFVLSQNLHRRQLTVGQRATVAARVANMKHGGDRKSDQEPTLALEPQVSIADAAKMTGASTGAVKAAKNILVKGDPDIVGAVEQGKLSLNAATKIVEHPPAVQREAADKIEAGQKGEEVVRELPVLNIAGDDVDEDEFLHIQDIQDDTEFIHLQEDIDRLREDLHLPKTAKSTTVTPAGSPSFLPVEPKPLLDIPDSPEKKKDEKVVTVFPRGVPYVDPKNEVVEPRVILGRLYLTGKWKASLLTQAEHSRAAKDLCRGLEIARKRGVQVTGEFSAGQLKIRAVCTKAQSDVIHNELKAILIEARKPKARLN